MAALPRYIKQIDATGPHVGDDGSLYCTIVVQIAWWYRPVMWFWRAVGWMFGPARVEGKA
jgi:hypothetical protein